MEQLPAATTTTTTTSKRTRDSGGGDSTYAAQLRIIGAKVQGLQRSVEQVSSTTAASASDAVATVLIEGERILREIEAMLTYEVIGESHAHCSSALRMHMVVTKTLSSLLCLPLAAGCETITGTSSTSSSSPAQIMFASLLSVFAFSSHLMSIFARFNLEWGLVYQQCLLLIADTAHRINPQLFVDKFLPKVFGLASLLSAILQSRPRRLPKVELSLGLHGPHHRVDLLLVSDISANNVLSAIVLLAQSILARRLPIRISSIDRRCLLQGVSTALSVTTSEDPMSVRVAEGGLSLLLAMSRQRYDSSFELDGGLLIWTVVSFARYTDLRQLPVVWGELMLELAERFFESPSEIQRKCASELIAADTAGDERSLGSPSRAIASSSATSSTSSSVLSSPAGVQFVVDVVNVALARSEITNAVCFRMVEMLTALLHLQEPSRYDKKLIVSAILSDCLSVSWASKTTSTSTTTASEAPALQRHRTSLQVARAGEDNMDECILQRLLFLRGTLLASHFADLVASAVIKSLSADGAVDLTYAGPSSVERLLHGTVMLDRVVALSPSGQLSSFLRPALSLLRSTCERCSELRMSSSSTSMPLAALVRRRVAAILGKCEFEDLLDFNLPGAVLWRDELDLLKNMMTLAHRQQPEVDGDAIGKNIALVDSTCFFWLTPRIIIAQSNNVSEPPAVALAEELADLARLAIRAARPAAGGPWRRDAAYLLRKIFAAFMECVDQISWPIFANLLKVLSEPLAAIVSWGRKSDDSALQKPPAASKELADLIATVSNFISARFKSAQAMLQLLSTQPGDKDEPKEIASAVGTGTGAIARTGSSSVVVDVDNLDNEDDAQEVPLHFAQTSRSAIVTAAKNLVTTLLELVGLTAAGAPRTSRGLVFESTVALDVARCALSLSHHTLFAAGNGEHRFDSLVFQVFSKSSAFPPAAQGDIFDASSSTTDPQSNSSRHSDNGETLLQLTAKCFAAMCLAREKFEIPATVWQEDNVEKLTYQLACVARMFRQLQATQDTAAADSNNDAAALKDCSHTVLSLLLAALHFYHRDLSNSSTTALVKSFSHQILTLGLRLQKWSAEDVVRMSPGIINDLNALQLLCIVSGCDTAAVAIRNADILYSPAALDASNSTGVAAFLRAAGGGVSKLHGDGKPAILAHMLVEHFGKMISGTGTNCSKISTSAAVAGEQTTLLQCIAKFAHFFTKKLEEIPDIIRRSFSASVVAILSYSDRASPEACCSAMAAVAALASCDATVADVKRAISTLSTRQQQHADDSDFKIVTSKVIEILDMLVRHQIGLSFEPVQQLQQQQQQQQQQAVPLLGQAPVVARLASHNTTVVTPYGKIVVSLKTQLRWLVALQNFIQFLNKKATLIAPKLPAVFDDCAKWPLLRLQVCKLWSSLIAAVEPPFLQSQGATFATNLFSLEQLLEEPATGSSLREEGLQFLKVALADLHRHTRSEAFWGAFRIVLQRSSKLITSIETTTTATKTSAASSLPNFSADDFVSSFVSVIRQSSGIKNHGVFVRALFAHLSYHCGLSLQKNASPPSSSSSTSFSPSIANAELLVRTLLGIASCKEDGASAAAASSTTSSSIISTPLSIQQIAANCVGIIGAVAPQRLGAGDAADDNGGNINNSLQTAVDFAHVDKWRELAFAILQHHCMRALNNTSDAVMHDRVAHAVQRLFRVCVSEERTETNASIPLAEDETVRVEELGKYSWWVALEDRTQKALLPFMNTKYHSQTIAAYDRRCPEIRAGMSFVEWRWNWYRNLASRATGVHAKIFDAVRNVAKRDPQLCSFLIPHLVLHILRCGTDVDLLDVYGEFAAVFQPEAAASLEEHVHQLFRVLENVRLVELSLKKIVIAASPELLTCPPPAKATNPIDRARLFLTSCSGFLSRLPQSLLVRAAIAVNAPMHALRFLEMDRHLPQTDIAIRRTPNLQKLFADLQDCESAIAVHNHTSFQEGDWGGRALSHERNGQWALALQACEIHLQTSPSSSAHQACALRCLQHLGQLHLMAHYAKSLIASSPLPSSAPSSSNAASPLISAPPAPPREAPSAELQQYASEAQWRLGMWDEISPMVAEQKYNNNSTFSPWTDASSRVRDGSANPTSIAAAVVALKRLCSGQSNLDAVLDATSKQRALAGTAAAAAAKESYAQAYPFVICLHALTDIDFVAKSIEALNERVSSSSAPSPSRRTTATTTTTTTDAKNKVIDRIDDWLARRLRVVQLSADSREVILALHRRVFGMLGAPDSTTSRTWVQYAKLLNESGFHDAALNAARQAAQFSNNYQKAFTTYAKLLYARGDFMQAVEYARSHSSNTALHSVATRGKLLLYATNWTQELSLQSPKEIAEGYKACLTLAKTEKAHFSLGRFYDKLFHATKTMLESSGANGNFDTMGMITAMETHALAAIEQYGNALLLGHKTHVIGLPRLLTLWLDCTAFLVTLKSNVTQRARVDPLAQRFVTRVERLLLPQTQPFVSPCILVTSISQLVSRLGHAHPESLNLLVRLLISLLHVFPQQSLWHLLPVYHNTKQPERSALVKNSIVGAYQKSGKEHGKIVDSAVIITSTLMDICNAAPAVFTNVKIEETTFARRLEKWFQTTGFVLPLISTLTPDVASGFAASLESSSAAAAATFSKSHIFHGFQGKVAIMSSLQKPKKINILTKGGLVVPFLCKAKDEPRKDLRMMDIAGLINNLFLDDATSRRKNFSLRRYAVAALSEDTALIEWVENTSVLRKVTDDAYALEGAGVTTAQVKEWKKKVDGNTMTAMEMFERHILPLTKPVMHQWLQRQFQQCSEWYAARGLFTQSCALWSIVGHVLGVGDRHAENLMIDTKSGEMLHIDFAYMFDKGETLEVPERVRFRLTQNLVDGMGVVGCDGPFRSACTTALRTQARHKDALMTVLDTLLHDPLVEWVTRPSGRDKVEPRMLFARVARRLDGFLDLYSEPKERDTFALSVEGQVAKLINHSSSLENLTRMYTWWMAWI